MLKSDYGAEPYSLYVSQYSQTPKGHFAPWVAQKESIENSYFKWEALGEKQENTKQAKGSRPKILKMGSQNTL